MPTEIARRIDAVVEFRAHESAAALAAANKRIGNILRKSGEDIPDEIDADRLVLDAEKALFGDLRDIEETIVPFLEAGDYSASLAHLAELRGPVDAFFDSVMVMDEDPLLRSNRLALLARLKSQFDRIADLSVLG